MGGKSGGFGAGLRRYGRLLRYAGAGGKGWAVIVALTLAISVVGLLQPCRVRIEGSSQHLPPVASLGHADIDVDELPLAGWEGASHRRESPS